MKVGESLLNIACKSNSENVVKYLISKGANVNAHNVFTTSIIYLSLFIN